MKSSNARVFHILKWMLLILKRFAANVIQQGHYTVLAATDQGRIVGFGALCESHALYAEGSFGILQEFYVLPEYRSQYVGRTLLEHIVEFAKSQKWVRLELCTPPIPAFDQTVAFYKDNGFEITGGYKMRYLVK